jgi:glycosyltransferase involved in cell wall biosynthesis
MIVGAEADIRMSELEQEIGRLGLEGHVNCLGPRYGEEKWEVLRRADVFIFPTFYRNEAFPVSILEAMQFSLPVISTPEGAIPDMVDDGRTGFLVKHNDPAGLAEKINILMDNPRLRVGMGKAGREKYEKKYRVEVFEKKMMDVFEAVLTEKSC